jgi:F1F0 ATPase subunit 2
MNEATLFEVARLSFAWICGLALGAFFFGGMWWTLRRGLSSARPALWMFGSLMLRMSITLLAFLRVADGRWQPLVLCLIGFVMARAAVSYAIESGTRRQGSGDREAGHAPQS